MEFFHAQTSDNLRLVGVFSRAKNPVSTVIHIHGFGGDFYSNAFVRDCHALLPQAGISFLSVGLRTTGYLTEIYSEQAVTYVGASIASHDDCRLDIDAAIAHVGAPIDSIVLQGHSFGTNVVKCYGRAHPEIKRLVFLSPADSINLHRGWLATGPSNPTLEGSSDGAIRWDLFGMAAGQARYPLPMSMSGLSRLLDSDVFREWSPDSRPVLQTALVVQGAADPIGLAGTTANISSLKDLLPHCSVVRIDGAGHLFADHESQMIDAVVRWIHTTSPSHDNG